MPRSIIDISLPRFCITPAKSSWAWCLVVLTLMSASVAAQRISVLAPDAADSSRAFAWKLETALAAHFPILDESMSMAAWSTAGLQTPFNLTTDQARTIGASMGCDYYVLVRSGTLRRSAYRRAEYYESHAAIFVISTRTGRLVLWRLLQFEAPRPADSDKSLSRAVDAAASEIADAVRSSVKAEVAEPGPAAMEEPPAADSPSAKNFRAPIPYRRIKPEYTAAAGLYDVAATVEILVDLDAEGQIKRTRIVRWAGYGLDESVEKTVREMNWRPAERNGKPLPMRFLLRYNFKKIEKD